MLKLESIKPGDFVKVLAPGVRTPPASGAVLIFSPGDFEKVISTVSHGGRLRGVKTVSYDQKTHDWCDADLQLLDLTGETDFPASFVKAKTKEAANLAAAVKAGIPAAPNAKAIDAAVESALAAFIAEKLPAFVQAEVATQIAAAKK